MNRHIISYIWWLRVRHGSERQHSVIRNKQNLVSSALWVTRLLVGPIVMRLLNRIWIIPIPATTSAHIQSQKKKPIISPERILLCIRVHWIRIIHHGRRICKKQSYITSLDNLRHQSSLDVPDLHKGRFKSQNVRFMKG